MVGQGETSMSATIINLIIQILSGAIVGNVAGSAAKNINLGGLGNTIAGAIGGLGGGQILSWIAPEMAGAGADATVSIGSIISQILGGGVGGGVLTAIVGAIKNSMAKA
jgi:hypothetical protein